MNGAKEEIGSPNSISRPAGPAPEVALVLPVYNESACIAKVLDSWRSMLQAERIPFVAFVLNDGSTDKTAESLKAFEGDPSFRIIHKANSGHGPTILSGYRLAVEAAPWVFQCDSDDEIAAASFPLLWSKRESVEGVFGIRTQRAQSLGRALISRISRWTVWMLAGRGVRDVNVPFRLMRSSVLKPVLEGIPPATFAPNVIISAGFIRCGAALANVPVPYQPRRTGSVSIVKWRLWKAAFRSFNQTIAWLRDNPPQQKRPEK